MDIEGSCRMYLAVLPDSRRDRLGEDGYRREAPAHTAIDAAFLPCLCGRPVVLLQYLLHEI